jgi:hemerythrin
VPIIEWNSSFLTGILEIDRHHQHLVALLNQVYDGHKLGISQYRLHSIIVELYDYANYHFSWEERLMKASSYPDFEGHKKEHDIFMRRII